MNQSELIQSISLRSGLSKTDAASCLLAFMGVVTQALKRYESVYLIGFGRFCVLERQERNGVNPRTQQPMRIPAMKTVVFKPGSVLKRKIKG